jgi:hypothetical protein
MERALRALPFEGLQLFRPSLLLGDRKEVRIGERVAALLAASLGWVMVEPAARYWPIEADAVAAAMVRVARAPLAAPTSTSRTGSGARPQTDLSIARIAPSTTVGTARASTRLTRPINAATAGLGNSGIPIS